MVKSNSIIIKSATTNSSSEKIILVDKEARHVAQKLASDYKTEYGWLLANWKLREAYGIYIEEPFPSVGDVLGNYTITHACKETGCIIKTQTRYLQRNKGAGIYA
ncbi:hypothetical protein A6J66_008715 [Yersinia enterocolitica]|nr:hypothetical protein A6J66_008715 [Yersinia enterocolitica]